MAKFLIVTVGGSSQPIVTAISSLKPNRVIFICSDGAKGSLSQVIGEGNPCELRTGGEVTKLPNIPTQARIENIFQKNRDLVLIQNPDDLSECYRLIAEKIRNLQQEFSDNEILADYTGGTKTMSVALAIAALDYGLTVYITTNTTRQNLIAIERGERSRRVAVASVTVQRKIEQFLPLCLQQYNYPAAISELENLSQTIELSPEDSSRVQELLDLCSGFDAWDRFNHTESWYFLKAYLSNKYIREISLFLKRVMTSREEFAQAVDDNFSAPEKMKAHGYEIVEDQILNAERRAILQRYDDAVARLYRALELLAQVRLWKEYKIKTGDLDIQKLPETIKAKYEIMRSSNGKIQLALVNSYELLNELPNDALGQLYQKNANAIKHTLQIRNYSILAHGLRPVSNIDYNQNLSKVIIPFIQSPHSQQPLQFPSSLNIETR
jgi:CRISPR-associated protein (TIGR02710 family)